jgi:NAD(P)-dependent dehydrogenase (short-subunit alcohol dehydrogenase family)
MDLQLKGKPALVSGSTAGIGLAIATTLAREGARVIINGRFKTSVDEVVASLKSETGGDHQGFAGDLVSLRSPNSWSGSIPACRFSLITSESSNQNPSKRFLTPTG